MQKEWTLARCIACLDKNLRICRALPSDNGGSLWIGSNRVETLKRYPCNYCKEGEYSGIYVVRGSGVFRDAAGQEFPLIAGDFFHRLPGVRHQMIPDVSSDWLEAWLVLPGLVWQGWASTLPGGDDATRFRPWRIGLRQPFLEKLIRMREALRKAQAESMSRLVLQMQDFLLDLWRAARKPSAHPASLIDRARQRLGSDLARPLDAKTVAQELGMGYETFRRWFQHEAGVSPGVFRIHARMERACTLLMEDNSSLPQIAHQLGYQDYFAFSRRFKKFAGCAPSVFVRQKKGPGSSGISGNEDEL